MTFNEAVNAIHNSADISEIKKALLSLLDYAKESSQSVNKIADAIKSLLTN